MEFIILGMVEKKIPIVGIYDVRIEGEKKMITILSFDIIPTDCQDQ